MVIQVMLYALIKNTNTGISELLVNALNLQCLHSLWKCTDADQLKQKSKFYIPRKPLSILKTQISNTTK